MVLDACTFGVHTKQFSCFGKFSKKNPLIYVQCGTNACHSTDTTVYVYAAAATITNSLGFVCSLNREKRMMWLNCTILYADIGLNTDDDDDEDDEERRR